MQGDLARQFNVSRVARLAILLVVVLALLTAAIVYAPQLRADSRPVTVSSANYSTDFRDAGASAARPAGAGYIRADSHSKQVPPADGYLDAGAGWQ